MKKTLRFPVAGVLDLQMGWICLHFWLRVMTGKIHPLQALIAKHYPPASQEVEHSFTLRDEAGSCRKR